jgi:hypothetical protein
VVLRDQKTGKLIEELPAITREIRGLLEISPGERLADNNHVGFPLLEFGSGRSRSGLTDTQVNAAVKSHLAAYADRVVLTDVAAEFTAAHAMSALTVRFKVITTGELGVVRVEYPA